MATFFQQQAQKEFTSMMGKLLEDPPLELMQKLASVMSNQ